MTPASNVALALREARYRHARVLRIRSPLAPECQALLAPAAEAGFLLEKWQRQVQELAGCVGRADSAHGDAWVRSDYALARSRVDFYSERVQELLLAWDRRVQAGKVDGWVGSWEPVELGEETVLDRHGPDSTGREDLLALFVGGQLQGTVTQVGTATAYFVVDGPRLTRMGQLNFPEWGGETALAEARRRVEERVRPAPARVGVVCG